MNNLAEIIIVFKLNFKCLTFGLTNPSWILTSITQAFHSTYQRSSLPSLPPSLLPPSLTHSSLPPSLTSSFPLINFFLPSSLPLPLLIFSLVAHGWLTHPFSPYLLIPPPLIVTHRLRFSVTHSFTFFLLPFLPPSFPFLLPSLPSFLSSFLPSFSPSLSAFFLRLLLPHSSPYYSFTSPPFLFCQLLRSFLLLPITHPRFPISVPLITLLISPTSHSLLHSQVPLFPSLSLNNHPKFLHPPGFPTSLTHPLPP